KSLGIRPCFSLHSTVHRALAGLLRRRFIIDQVFGTVARDLQSCVLFLSYFILSQFFFLAFLFFFFFNFDDACSEIYYTCGIHPWDA
ncbi:hypothetical protein GIB67_032600, partial [Kingdonia uniflora]